jgi:hypothetical protein
MRAFAVHPDGTLYGANGGIVYRVNWSSGALENIITGYPSLPNNILPFPQTWFVFDNSGNTLYMPAFNFDDSNSYIIACYLPSGVFNISTVSPSSFYSVYWFDLRYAAYYGKIYIFFVI